MRTFIFRKSSFWIGEQDHISIIYFSMHQTYCFKTKIYDSLHIFNPMSICKITKVHRTCTLLKLNAYCITKCLEIDAYSSGSRNSPLNLCSFHSYKISKMVALSLEILIRLTSLAIESYSLGSSYSSNPSMFNPNQFVKLIVWEFSDKRTLIMSNRVFMYQNQTQDRKKKAKTHI